MRSLYLILFLMMGLSGCNVFESDTTSPVVRDFDVISAEIKSAEVYIYNLGSIGDEEQATIKEESPNASVSELFYDFDGAAVVKYRYQSKADFTGEDTVVLEIRRGSDGASPNKDIYYIVLHFKIETEQ